MNLEFVKKSIGVVAGAVLSIALASNAGAAIVSSVDAYTSADGSHPHTSGTTTAAVGRWFGEEVRGIFEFDISTLMGSSSASLTFGLADRGSLIYGSGGSNYVGDFNVIAFEGNGDANDSDFSALGTIVGTASALGLSVGESLTFDVTGALSGITGDYIGFLLDPLSDSTSVNTEVVFTSFILETVEGAVPEASTLAIFSLGLAGLVAMRRRKTA